MTTATPPTATMKISALAHERLFVYQLALEFARTAEGVASRIPKLRRDLARRLRGAATELPLRVAAGAADPRAQEKVRIYRAARASATRCAALLDICRQLEIVQDVDVTAGRRTLERLVAMLDRIIRNHLPAEHV